MTSKISVRSKNGHIVKPMPPPAYTVEDIVDQLSYGARLTPVLRTHFVPLDADKDTQLFLSECLRKYGSWSLRNIATSAMRRFLGMWMSHTDVLGYLGWFVRIIYHGLEVEMIHQAVLFGCDPLLSRQLTLSVLPPSVSSLHHASTFQRPHACCIWSSAPKNSYSVAESSSA